MKFPYSLFLVSNLAIPALAQGTKISAPLKMPSGLLGGPVLESALTPDGARVVFRAPQDFSDLPELYVAPTDGSQPAQKLSGVTATTPQNSVLGFQLGSDGTWAAYHLGGASGEFGALYSVRVDGSAAPIALGQANAYALSPDGTRIACLQGGSTLELRNLDGSGTPVALGTGSIGWIAFTPDGARVVYLQTFSVHLDGQQYFPRRLFSVPADGSAPPVQLSASPLLNGSVDSARLSADGARVVYVGGQDALARKELFSVPVAGGAPVRLNGTLFTNGFVTQYGLSADSSRAVYVANQERSQRDLYSVPIAGGTPVRLDPALGTTAAVPGIGTAFKLSPDGRRVLFTIRPAPGVPLALYLANVDGSGSARRLEPQVVLFSWSPDGRRAIYQASETPGITELYSRQVVGKHPRHASLGAAQPDRVKLNGPLDPLGDVISFEVSPDGARVLYRADQEAPDIDELYSVPIDGSGPAVKLNPALVSGGDVVTPLDLSADGATALYYADGETDGVVELFAVPAAGGPAVKLNGTLDPGAPYSDVNAVFLSPDGSHAVYQEISDFSSNPVLDLHGVDLANHAVASLALPMPGRAKSATLRFGPDSSRIAFLVSDTAHPPPEDLYSAPVDGSAAPLRLNPPLGSDGEVPQWAFTPDGTRIAFQAFSNEPFFSELYGVPADGSAPAVLLDTDLHPMLLMHPDGERVAYYAGTERDLWLTRLDGTSTPTLLVDSSVPHGPTRFATPPFRAQFTADGSRIVFCDDLAVTHYDLYSVATTGGPPLLLNGPLVAGGNVQRFELTADGTRAIYLADQDVNGLNELYTVPVDGSSPALVLSQRPSVSVRRFLLSPDGTRVAFDQGALCVVPSDGSAPPTVRPMGLAESSALAFSPDGDWIVVHSFDSVLSVPTEGSAAGVEVNATLDDLQHDVPKFLISADSQWVVYRSTPVGPDYIVHLYASALDGGSAPVQLDAPLVPRGSVGGVPWENFANTYVLTPDGRALYVADHDRSGVFELYESLLP